MCSSEAWKANALMFQGRIVNFVPQLQPNAQFHLWIFKTAQFSNFAFVLNFTPQLSKWSFQSSNFAHFHQSSHFSSQIFLFGSTLSLILCGMPHCCISHSRHLEHYPQLEMVGRLWDAGIRIVDTAGSMTTCGTRRQCPHERQLNWRRHNMQLCL